MMCRVEDLNSKMEAHCIFEQGAIFQVASLSCLTPSRIKLKAIMVQPSTIFVGNKYFVDGIMKYHSALIKLEL